LGIGIAFFNVNLSNSNGTFLAILDQIPALTGTTWRLKSRSRAAIRRRQDG